MKSCLNSKYLNYFLKNSFQFRSYATLNHINKIVPPNDKSLAIVSLSNNIYYNLALENYLAESLNFKNRNILLLWISEPCIVFGRHQNPWLECNVKEADSKSVKTVRRYSGGGCVYHDLGNLNISFLTDRLKYDRKHNLTVIKDTLDKCNFKDVQFEISPRHDIFMKTITRPDESFKISGSAARLAHKFSYHHCTLLFDSNIENMKLLRSNFIDKIETKATQSVRSKCLNLRQFLKEENLNINLIIEKLCQEFWRLNSNNWGSDYLFNYVNPEEEEISKYFDKNLKELQSWDFRFGATPKFQLKIDLEQYRNLVLNIVNGELKDYQIDTKDLENENFKNGLNLLLGSKLQKEVLNGLFNQHNLVNLDEKFDRLLDFINKNIS